MTSQRRITEAELHAYVDGELAQGEHAEIEALLAAAPAEFAAARAYRELNDALEARYAGRLSEPVPPQMLHAASRIRPQRPQARRLAQAAAVLLMVAAAGVAGYIGRGLVNQPASLEPAFVLNAIGAHTVYLPEVRHPVEVGATEEHLIRWLTKRVGAPVRAPSLASSGWKLMGGRLLPDQGQAAAQFMYEDATGRRFTLYIRRETRLANTAFRFVEHGQFGAFYWIDHPLGYALAGRLTRDELMHLANLVYAKLEQRP